MNFYSRFLIPILVFALSFAVSTCTRSADYELTKLPAPPQDAATTGDGVPPATGVVASDTSAARPGAAERAAASVGNALDRTVDTTKDVALAVAATTRDAAVATGEAVTDAWITTHLRAKFVDEDLLDDSDINVDTRDHVVTLKGTVTSALGKARAAAIARDTRGVKHVINAILVK
jgi:hyperosmotically inducible protein